MSRWTRQRDLDAVAAANRWESSPAAGRWERAPSSGVWIRSDEDDAVADLDGKLYSASLQAGIYTGLGSTGYGVKLASGTVVDPVLNLVGADLPATFDDWSSRDATPAVFEPGGTGVTRRYTPVGAWGAAGAVTGYYTASVNTVGNIGTLDFLVRIIARWDGVANRRLASKRLASPDSGWDCVTVGSDLWFYIKDGSANSATPKASSLVSGEWHDIWYVGDRSASCQAYVNAVASGSPVLISAVGDISTTQSMNLLSLRGTGTGEHTIALFQIFTAADIGSHLQPALVAEMHARLDSKWLARHADGDTSRVAEINTRASQKILERYEGGKARWHKLSANWLGCGRRLNDAATHVVAGTDHWDQRTQLNPFPQAFNSWNSKVKVTITPDNAEGMFEGETTMDLVTESTDVGDESHYSGTSSISWTSGTTYTAWGVGKFKTGGRAWIKLQLGANLAFAFFDIQNGTVGTTGGSYFDDARIRPLGDGRYLFELIWTPTATAGQVFYYQPCDADNSTTYTGDGRDCFWLECVQLEAGDCASPLIGAGATRSPDMLAYAVPTAIRDLRKLALQVDAMTRKGSVALTSTIATMAYPSGPAGKRHSIFWGFPTAAKPGYYVQDGGVPCSIAGTSDLTDGEVHSVRVRADTDLFELWVDGAREAQDLSGSGPQDQDRLWVGSSYSAGSEVSGLIPRVTLDHRSSFVRPPYAPEAI